MTFDLHRNLHHDGLVGINLKEVDVEESVLHGLELQLFHHNLDVLAVELEVYLEDVGSVDELAYILTPDCDVGGDDAALVIDLHELLSGFESAVIGKFHDGSAIDHGGNQTFLAEVFYGFFAELNTGLSL